MPAGRPLSPHTRALLALVEQRPRSARELAGELGRPTESVSMMLRDLKRAGYVVAVDKETRPQRPPATVYGVPRPSIDFLDAPP